MSSMSHSRAFFDFIKAIGECRSKEEEDGIVLAELARLKERVKDPKLSKRARKEDLVRMIYIEMLGNEVSFAYINAVKMLNDSDILSKRIAHLAVCLCLHPEHELMLLLVNSLQKDLKSPNHLEVAFAIHTVAKLVNRDLLPAIAGLVGDCLDHKHPAVRKKAVMAIKRFRELDHETVSGYTEKAKRLICDKDPAVMGASLHLILDLANENPVSVKELIPSLISILRQITEHRLPREFDYHRMPAPWIQIKLLQILAPLGAMDRDSSVEMYEVLREVLHRADIGINVGFAIIYECVKTITAIFPDAALLAEAAKCISRFVTSESHNLKYLGVNGLASIVQVDPKYALDHQLLVIDCLEDPDETLRRKTLGLLFKMTNPSNIVIIVEKLIASLKSTHDVYLREELVLRITQLAERFAPDTFWYVDVMNALFEIAGELIQVSMVNSLMKFILESEDVDTDGYSVKKYACESYLSILSRPVISDLLLKVIAWTLGEFGHEIKSLSLEDIMTDLCGILERPLARGSDIRCFVVSALLKLSARLKTVPPLILEHIKKSLSSVDVDLQQRSHEFLELVQDFQTLSAVLPEYQASEDIQIDEELSFLNDYVNVALSNGARPYSPLVNAETSKDALADSAEGCHLIFEPYSAPDVPLQAVYSEKDVSTHVPSEATKLRSSEEALRIKSITKKKWGPEGYYEEPTKPSSVDTSMINSSAAHQSYPSIPRRSITPPMDSKPSISSISTLPENPVENEKQKLAAALFGGLGAKSASNRATSRSKHKRVLKKNISNSSQETNVDSVAKSQTLKASPLNVDLLDINFESPAKDKSLHEQSTTIDLLDMSSMNQALPIQSSRNPVENEFLFDLNAKPGPSESVAFDLLSICQSNPVENIKAIELVSDSLRAQITAFPRSSESDEVIFSDNFIQVSTIKAWAPQETILVILLASLTEKAIESSSFSFDLSSDYRTRFTGEPHVQIQGNTVSLAKVTSTTSGAILLSISPQSLSQTVPQSNIHCKAQYRITSSAPPNYVDFPLHLSFDDFIRPLAISTNAFGTKWKQTTSEVKFQISTSLLTAVEFSSACSSQLRLHPVQSIGDETILAGYLLPNTTTIFLLHTRLGPNGLIQGTARAGSKILADNFASAVKLRLG